MTEEIGNEEMKKENKRPLGLDVVLFFSAIFAMGMLMIGFTAFSFSSYSSQYPILFIAQLALSLAGFLLILSVVGLWLQKKIAYWSMMFAWVVIMFSGLYTNYVIEIKTGGFIPAGPGGFIPDFLFYGVIPIAIVFYMLTEKSKIENWIEIKNLYQEISKEAWFVPPMVVIMLAYLISVMEQDPLLRIGLYAVIIGQVFVIIWLVYKRLEKGEAK